MCLIRKQVMSHDEFGCYIVSLRWLSRYTAVLIVFQCRGPKLIYHNVSAFKILFFNWTF